MKTIRSIALPVCLLLVGGCGSESDGNPTQAAGGSAGAGGGSAGTGASAGAAGAGASAGAGSAGIGGGAGAAGAAGSGGTGGALVFPGAIGPAAKSPAGRGGKLYLVTTLANAGAGSLRECVEASGPRVCAFEVSGEIKLTKALTVKSPFLTIAGQTAPSPGITVRDRVFDITTHDVLIQHMRFRLGLAAGGNSDAFALRAGSTDVYNITTDHCSMSWGRDGSWDAWRNAGKIHSVTISDTIISETLIPHSLGNLFGEGPSAAPSSYDGVVIARNYYAHNGGRNPRLAGAGKFAVFNNLVYNYAYSASQFDDGKSGHPGTHVSLVNNHWFNGPSKVNLSRPPVEWQASLEPAELFVSGNKVDEKFMADQSNVVNNFGKTPLPLAAQSPVDLKPYNILSVESVLDTVTSNAGARPKDRDAVDARLVADVKAKTGKIIADPAEVGGYPKLAENTRKLTPPADPSGDSDKDGYTNLEEWLHSFYKDVQ